ncbi:MAG: hypothetical protein ACI392_00530 [Paludibacteraceae bacterium]
MKRLLFTLLCATLVSAIAADDAPVKDPIVLKTYAEYGYNTTWGHFGHIAVGGYFPITTYFDLQAAIDLCTANSYALDGRATVRFPLRVGQLALENRLLYRAIICSATHEACAALSLGYRMDYFAVSIGAFSRFYSPMDNDHHTQNAGYMVEPFNLLWNIEGHVRRENDFWNIGLRISNFDDFQIERFNEPIFTLVGRYNPTEKIHLFAEVYCKPSGMLHGAANFYNAGARIGLNYIFKRR